MAGPHEDMSVTLWSTEQCLTFLVQRNSVASCYHSSFGSVSVCVCVYCMYGLGEVKGTKSFVTCGFRCLVLKLMTNLWGVCPCVCSYLLACVWVMSCMKASFSHTLRSQPCPCRPTQFADIAGNECVFAYTHLCVCFFYCFRWTYAADHRETLACRLHHPRLPSTIMTPAASVCLCTKTTGVCVSVCVFCSLQSERRRNPTLQACLSLRRKLDRRRV